MITFGLAIPPSAEPGSDPVGLAQRAEELGFDFVGMSDHPCGTDPTYENWTVLSWIAAATSRIRIGPRVLGVPYRAPALVAKMAETFDRLSGGRLILGLGGGSADHEFRAFGLGVPTPREKVDGMEDAIRIARGLWSERSFTYGGRRYRTEAADIEPKPERRIPIWLGTYGPRALAVTGQLADGWIPSYGFAPPDQVPALRDRLMRAAADAGRDPAELTCAYHVSVAVNPRTPPGDGVVSGTPDEVAAELSAFTKLGFTAFSLSPVGDDIAGQAELLAREVVPRVNA